jgi:hypothetical protein
MEWPLGTESYARRGREAIPWGVRHGIAGETTLCGLRATAVVAWSGQSWTPSDPYACSICADAASTGSPPTA